MIFLWSSDLRSLQRLESNPPPQQLPHLAPDSRRDAPGMLRHASPASVTNGKHHLVTRITHSSQGFHIRKAKELLSKSVQSTSVFCRGTASVTDKPVGDCGKCQGNQVLKIYWLTIQCTVSYYTVPRVSIVIRWTSQQFGRNPMSTWMYMAITRISRTPDTLIDKSTVKEASLSNAQKLQCFLKPSLAACSKRNQYVMCFCSCVSYCSRVTSWSI